MTWAKPVGLAFDRLQDFLAENPGQYAGMQKHDGHFIRVVYSPSEGFSAFNAKGKAKRVIPAPLMAREELFKRRGFSFEVVGEALGSANNWHGFVIFDVLKHSGMGTYLDLEQTPPSKRLLQLHRIYSELAYARIVTPQFPGVAIARPVHGEVNIYDLALDLRHHKPPYEGIVLTPLVVKGNSYKVVNIFEADVVCRSFSMTSGTRLGGSAPIEVYKRNGKLMSVGNVGTGFSQTDIRSLNEHFNEGVGHPLVFKVRFHGKRTIGTTLNQAAFAGVRGDKYAHECTTVQFEQYYGFRFERGES